MKEFKELIQKMVGGVNTTKITLNGEEIEALIDSGSQVSTITEKLYNKQLEEKARLTSDGGFPITIKNCKWWNHTLYWIYTYRN